MDMANLTEILERFNANLDEVRGLMAFDQVILDFATNSLANLERDLKENDKLAGAAAKIQKTKVAIEQVSKHGSLAPKYAQMHNQCLVLLVSYFGSALKELYSYGIDALVNSDVESDALDETINLSLRDVSEIVRGKESSYGNIIAQKRSVEFHEIGSCIEELREVFGVSLADHQITNDIGFAQAARNAIVHRGGVVDKAMLRHLKKHMNRTLYPNILVDEAIKVDKTDLEIVMKAMQDFLVGLITELALKKGLNVA